MSFRWSFLFIALFTCSVAVEAADTYPPQWTNGVGLLKVNGTDDGFVLLWNPAEEQPDPNTSETCPPVYYNLYRKTGLGGLNWDPSEKQARIAYVNAPPGAGYTYMYRITGINYNDAYSLGLRAEDNCGNEENNTVVWRVNALDQAPPFINPIRPLRNATGVATNTNVSLHILDLESGVNLSTLSWIMNGVAVSPYESKGDQTDRQVTYVWDAARSSNLPENTAIRVQVRAKDFGSTLGGNQMDTVYSFRTGQDHTPPYVTDQNPANGQRNVPRNSHIQYHVRDDGNGADWRTINMTVEGSAITTTYLKVETANYQDQEADYTHYRTFDPEEWVTWQVTADDFANIPNHLVSTTYSFQTELDMETPRIFGEFPLRNSSTAAINTSVSVHVGDNLGVDRTTLDLLVDGVLLIRGGVPQTPEAVIVGTEKDYFLKYSPSSTFTPNSSVSVHVIARDRALNRNLLDTTYNFTVAGGLDGTPPFVTQRIPDANTTVVLPNIISFHVKDLGVGVDLSSLNVKFGNSANDFNVIINGDNKLAKYNLSSIVGTAADLQIAIKPFFQISHGDRIHVLVRASDLASPANVMPTEQYHFTALKDLIPPTAKNYNPTRSQTNVARNSQVYLEVSDVGAGLDRSSVKMTLDSVSVSPTLSGLYRDKTSLPQEYGVMYHPDGNFTVSQVVQVHVSAKDAALPPPNPQDVNSFVDTYQFTVGSTFDHTPPTSTLTSVQNGDAFNDQNVIITGTATDNFSGVQLVTYRSSNHALILPTSGHESFWFRWFLPGDGIYTLKSQATDNCGNLETLGTGTRVIVDRFAPDSSFSKPTANQKLSGSTFDIQVSVTDTVPGYVAASGVTSVSLKTSDQPSANTLSGAPWKYTWTLPADGRYTLTSLATDRAGNLELLKAQVAVIVDNTPPMAVFSNASDGSIFSGSAKLLRLTATDNLAGIQGVEVSVDRGPWNAAAFNAVNDDWQYSWTLPADGFYSLFARATDQAGNVQSPVTGIAVQVANTLPACDITAPAPGSVIASNQFTITGTAEDVNVDLNKVEVYIQPGPGWVQATGLQNWTYQWNFGADGVYSLASRATNAIGLQSPDNGKFRVWVDRLNPNGTLTEPQQNAVLGSNLLHIEGEAVDLAPSSGFGTIAFSLGSFQASLTLNDLSGTVPWSYDWNLALEGVTNGSYTLTVTASDRGGNSDPTPPTRTLLVDRDEPPTSVVTSHQAGDCINGVVRIEGRAHDGTSGVDVVEMSFDNGANWYATTLANQGDLNTTWTYDLNTALYPNGSVRLVSRATDRAGNEQLNPTGPLVSLDRSSPDVTILAPTNREYFQLEPITAEGTVSEVGCGLDAVELFLGQNSVGTADFNLTRGTWSSTFTPPADGLYTLFVEARDDAGNTSTRERVLFTADGTDPAVAVTDPATNSILNTRSVSVQGTASDVTAGLQKVEVSTSNGRTYANATGLASWTYQWTASVDGIYTLLARAEDKSANQKTSSAVKVTVDTSDPAITITTPTSGSYVNSSPVTIQGTATDTLSGLDAITVSTDAGRTFTAANGTAAWSYAWQPATDGTYTLIAKATDKAGNEKRTAAQTVTVDRQRPLVSLAGYMLTSLTASEGGTWSIWCLVMDYADLDRVELGFDGQLSGVELNHDGTYPELYTLDIPIPGGAVPRGGYPIEIWAIDHANNRSVWPYLNVYGSSTSAPEELALQQIKFLPGVFQVK